MNGFYIKFLNTAAFLGGSFAVSRVVDEGGAGESPVFCGDSQPILRELEYSGVSASTVYVVRLSSIFSAIALRYP